MKPESRLVATSWVGATLSDPPPPPITPPCFHNHDPFLHHPSLISPPLPLFSLWAVLTTTLVQALSPLKEKMELDFH